MSCVDEGRNPFRGETFLKGDSNTLVCLQAVPNTMFQIQPYLVYEELI